MKAKCKRCGDTVEVTRLREFKTCKCGAIALDYGDGEHYYRTVGNLENFDGEIEDVPKIKDLGNPNRYKVKSRQMGKQGAIADAEFAESARDYLQRATKVKKSFMNVNVDLCEDGTLYIDDAESDEQLVIFHIKEEDGR